MNTHRGREGYKILSLFLDGGCSSTIVMRRLTPKLQKEISDVKQWKTQAGVLELTRKLK